MSETNPNIIRLFTDGSFNNKTKIPTWGYIAVRHSKIVFKEKGQLEGKICSMRQIGAELAAICYAVDFCKDNNYIGRIYHDFTGCFNWVRDFFIDQKPWKTNNEWTQEYRQFIKLNREYIDGFVWIKGHSGNQFNEAVDKYINEK